MHIHRTAIMTAGLLAVLLVGAPAGAADNGLTVLATPPASAGQLRLQVEVTDPTLQKELRAAGASPERFRVAVDHAGAQVTALQRMADTGEGSYTILAFDQSGSFSPHWPRAFELAKAYAGALGARPRNHTVAVMTFGKSKATHCQETSAAGLEACLDKVQRLGTHQLVTRLKFYIQDAMREAARKQPLVRGGSREVIVFTDAGEESSALSLKKLVGDARELGVRLHVVVFSDGMRGRGIAQRLDEMSQLASGTGGRYIQVEDVDARQALAGLVGSLEHIYWLDVAFCGVKRGQTSDRLFVEALSGRARTAWSDPVSFRQSAEGRATSACPSTVVAGPSPTLPGSAKGTASGSSRPSGSSPGSPGSATAPGTSPSTSGSATAPGTSPSTSDSTTPPGAAPGSSGAATAPGTSPSTSGSATAPGTAPGSSGSTTRPGPGKGSRPGTPAGSPGALTQPGTATGSPGTAMQPGGGVGTPGAPTQPGSGTGTPGTAMQPGGGMGAPAQQVSSGWPWWLLVLLLLGLGLLLLLVLIVLLSRRRSTPDPVPAPIKEATPAAPPVPEPPPAQPEPPPAVPAVWKDPFATLPETRLRVTRGPPGLEPFYRVHKSSFTIGARSGEMDLAVDLPQLSGHHVTVQLFKVGNVYVKDENSTNGTFVDGRRLNPGERVQVKPGQSIRLSQHLEFTLEQPGLQPSAEPPPAGAPIAAAPPVAPAAPQPAAEAPRAKARTIYAPARGDDE
jgi:hypothetical protein